MCQKKNGDRHAVRDAIVSGMHGDLLQANSLWGATLNLGQAFFTLFPARTICLFVKRCN